MQDIAAFWPVTAAAAHASLLKGLLVTALFAVVGHRTRGVTRSGAWAGFGIAFILYACAGVGAFVVLVALFGVTFLATRLGHPQKLAAGVAERSEGRDGWQVLANLGVSSCAAVAYWYFRQPALLGACAAALAEAAADTVSSECGQAFRWPARLLTTGARVAAGTNGGVSLGGTACGALAALGLSLVAGWCHLLPMGSVGPVTAAALVGVFVDSLLGATLERPGGLTKNSVNLAGTLAAALLAWGWLSH